MEMWVDIDQLVEETMQLAQGEVVKNQIQKTNFSVASNHYGVIFNLISSPKKQIVVKCTKSLNLNQDWVNLNREITGNGIDLIESSKTLGCFPVVSEALADFISHHYHGKKYSLIDDSLYSLGELNQTWMIFLDDKKLKITGNKLNVNASGLAIGPVGDFLVGQYFFNIFFQLLKENQLILDFQIDKKEINVDFDKLQSATVLSFFSLLFNIKPESELEFESHEIWKLFLDSSFAQLKMYLHELHWSHKFWNHINQMIFNLRDDQVLIH